MARTRANPHNLGPRGLKLFKSIPVEKVSSDVDLVNLVEACRIADRLENLNSLINGDEDVWFRMKFPRSGEGVVEVLINDPLKEARLYATALRQLLTPFTEVKPAQHEKPEVTDAVDEIGKRRQARRAAASS